jgi:hypothetical protein
MNKNLIMIVGALCVVLLIVFWVQYSVVRSLQSAATSTDGTTGVPTNSGAPNHAAAPAGTAAAPSGTQPAPAVGKKTTISAPVHKKH